MSTQTLYTYRWYSKEIEKAATDPTKVKKLAKELTAELTKEIGDGKAKPAPEPKGEDRPSPMEPGQKLLRIPFAEQVTPEMKTQGTYRKGYPEGLVLHFTAGHQTQTGSGGVTTGRNNGHTYLFMTADGVVHQAFPLNKWGYHAGTSYYPGLGSGVSKYLVGLEVANAGKLTGNKTWFGKTLPASEIRTVKAKDNVIAGSYQKYTKEQEEAIINLCLWLKANNPDVFNLDYVVGHDEVCSPKGRKNDPGGALSMTMPELRTLLKARWEKMKA